MVVKESEHIPAPHRESPFVAAIAEDLVDHTEVIPFGEEDVNLWTKAVRSEGEVEVHFGAPDIDGASDTQSASGDKSVGGSQAEDQDTSFLCRMFDFVKYVYSTALLIFCIVVVSAAIFSRQTTATGDYNLHPAIAFIVFWTLLLWLALMEGGLNCMVGLQPIAKALYAQSHPQTTRCTTLAHRGDNIERFIVGRQFLDLMIVFMTSFMVSAISNANVLGLPTRVSEAFFNSGLAVILVTIVFGQLTTQINAAHSMLDFMNKYAMVATTYLALTVEMSGLLHAVYLIQIAFAKATGKPIKTHEQPRNTVRKLFFWGRVFLSTSILIFALVVTFTAVFEGKTTMWAGVPPWASFIMLITLILLTGLMEGLQIAFFEVVHLPEGALDKHSVAQRNCALVFSGQNLQTFLIGRQIFQTIVMFLIARITTIESGDGNLFGVGNGLQNFFNTGVLGALFSTILASLSWRVIASSFPLAFLSNPLASFIIRICILVENSGVCYSSWIIAALHRRVAGYKLDEQYLGKASELSSTSRNDLELMEGDGTEDGSRSCKSTDSESAGHR